MNISNSELFSKIKHSIQNKNKLSVVRCGDGEFHLLKNEYDFDERSRPIHRSAMTNILNRNGIWRCSTHMLPDGSIRACKCYLDSKVAMSWVGEIKGYIIDAIKNTDYLGLSVPNKDPRFYSISNDVLERNTINTNTLNIVNSTFPRSPEFGSLLGFKTLIQNNDIHIITPNVGRFKKSNVDKMLGINISYTDISGERSYKLRNMIKSSIKDSGKKIFLFGGGAAIKDLIPWSSKEMNAVSIDVGSVLDGWSSTPSRKYIDDPNFSYLKWKN